MIADGKPAKEITSYVVGNKIRNITGNYDLNDDQVKLMVDLLDEVSPKGVFKQLNDDIRQQLKKNK